MPHRGNNNHNHGRGGRGGQGSPNRARGNGRGRGRGEGGGRGFRGGFGAGFHPQSVTHPMNEVDFVLQQWPDENTPPHTRRGTPFQGSKNSPRSGSVPQSGYSSPRNGNSNGRGFPRGGTYSVPRGGTPLSRGSSGTNTPRGQGRRGGRGGGRGGKPTIQTPLYVNASAGVGPMPPRVEEDLTKASATERASLAARNQFSRGGTAPGEIYEGSTPLSVLLYSGRPLLRPVVFVRGTHTGTLFQDEEEILDPHIDNPPEDMFDDEAQNEEEERTHVPTADRVSRIFSGTLPSPPSDSENDDDEEIEEVDFDDLGKLLDGLKQEEPAPAAANTGPRAEATFTGFYATSDISMAEQTDDTQTAQDEMEVEHLVSTLPTSPPQHTDQRIEESTVLLVTDGTILPPPNPVSVEVSTEVLVQVASEAPAIPPQLCEALQSLPDPDPDTPVADPVFSAPPADDLPAPELFFVDTEPARPPSQQVDEHDDLFFVDTTPTPTQENPYRGLEVPMSGPSPLGTTKPSAEEDGETIVYVAPHPKQIYPRGGAGDGSGASTPVNEGLTRSVLSGMKITEAPLKTTGTSTTNGIPASDDSSAPLPFSHPKLNSASSVPTSQTLAPRPIIPPHTPRSQKKQAMKERISLKRQLASQSRSKSSKSSRSKRAGGFGQYGAMMSEAVLRGERDPRWEERRRGDSDVEWGDEDDDEGQGQGQVYTLSASAPATRDMDAAAGPSSATSVYAHILHKGNDDEMSVDPDLAHMSTAGPAMLRFAQGLVGREAGVFVTADDLEDERVMKEEDRDMLRAGSEGSDSDGDDDEDEDEEDEEDEDEEVDEAVWQDEEDMIDEDNDEEDAGAESSPGFETRLQELRLENAASAATGKSSRSKKIRGKGKGKQKWDQDEDESDDDDDFFMEEDDDSDLIDELNAILDANQHILDSRNDNGKGDSKTARRTRKKLFSQIRDGAFDTEDLGLDAGFQFEEDEYEEDELIAMGLRPGKRKNKPPTYLTPELQAQWEQDRQAKASRKALRQEAKLLTAANPYVKKRGRKKGRKASRLAESMGLAPPMFDEDDDDDEDMLGMDLNLRGGWTMPVLETQFRKFCALSLPHSQSRPHKTPVPHQLPLPAMPKPTRVKVHQLATAFGLKSVSKGKGDNRYITLVRTTKTGLRIDERKVRRLIGAGYTGSGSDLNLALGSRLGRAGGGGGGGSSLKPREGDHVGSSAPRLSETNIGFQMLAKLGWEQGMRIGGLAGTGLDQPLKAVIKRSKAGLGAGGGGGGIGGD